MAAKRGKAKTATKAKKKSWYTILAPKLFNNTVVGETLSTSPALLEGRTIDHNLMYLSGDARNQNILVKLVIDSVKEGKALTSMVGYRIMPTALKRYVRKGKDKIEDSVYFRTADNKIVWVKPFILTYLNTTRAKRTDVRLNVRSQLAYYFSKTTFDAMLNDIVSGQLQNKIRQNIRKIIPIRGVEIRSMLLVSETLKIKKNIITLDSLPKRAFQAVRRNSPPRRAPAPRNVAPRTHLNTDSGSYVGKEKAAQAPRPRKTEAKSQASDE